MSFSLVPWPIQWRLNGMQAMIRGVWRLCGWKRTQKIAISIGDHDRIPVIFCTWRRLERLPKTLEMLAAQSVPLQAVIWDNSGQPDTVATAAENSPIPVTVYHSKRNIGGYGRFYLAAAAAVSGHKAVIFIDDDADFGPNMVADLLSGHQPRSVSGWFAFKTVRPAPEQVAGPGESAAYLGTCGMITDTEIFTEPSLFACPRRYWFVEDLWFSDFAAKHGYAIYRSPSKLDIEEFRDGRNQSITLGWARWRFERYLASRPARISQ